MIQRHTNNTFILGLAGIISLAVALVLFNLHTSSVRAEMGSTNTGSGSWYGEWDWTAVSGSGTTFTDVTGHWSQSYIIWLSSHCGVTGYRDNEGNLLGKFGPNNNVTRAEFVKMLIGCTHGNPSTGSGSTGSGSTGSGSGLWTGSGSVFPDLSVTHWGYAYIAKAKELGIVTGYADGKFYPNQNITRAEILAIALRSQFSEEAIENAPAGSFSDVWSGAWYVRYINFGASKAIVSGYKNANGDATGAFGPDNPATRGEAAKIISNGVNAG